MITVINKETEHICNINQKQFVILLLLCSEEKAHITWTPFARHKLNYSVRLLKSATKGRAGSHSVYRVS